MYRYELKYRTGTQTTLTQGNFVKGIFKHKCDVFLEVFTVKTLDEAKSLNNKLKNLKGESYFYNLDLDHKKLSQNALHYFINNFLIKNNYILDNSSFFKLHFEENNKGY
jgi:hypothetical protein